MKKTRQQILEEVRIHNSLLIENKITDFIVSPEVRGIVNAAALVATIAAPFFPAAGLVAGAARGLQVAQVGTAAAAAADVAWNPDTKLVGNPSDYATDAVLGIGAISTAKGIQKAITGRADQIGDIVNYRVGGRVYRAPGRELRKQALDAGILTSAQHIRDPAMAVRLNQRASSGMISNLKSSTWDRFIGRPVNTNINRVQQNIDATLKRLNAPAGVGIDVSSGLAVPGSANSATKQFFQTITDKQFKDALTKTLRRERPLRQFIPAGILAGSSQPSVGLLTPELGREASDRESPSVLRVIGSGGDIKQATRNTRFMTSALPRPRGLLSPAQQLGVLTSSPASAAGDLVAGFATSGLAGPVLNTVGTLALASRFRN